VRDRATPRFPTRPGRRHARPPLLLHDLHRRVASRIRLFPNREGRLLGPTGTCLGPGTQVSPRPRLPAGIDSRRMGCRSRGHVSRNRARQVDSSQCSATMLAAAGIRSVWLYARVGTACPRVRSGAESPSRVERRPVAARSCVPGRSSHLSPARSPRRAAEAAITSVSPAPWQSWKRAQPGWL
jgi:hypothetical protein